MYVLLKNCSSLGHVYRQVVRLTSPHPFKFSVLEEKGGEPCKGISLYSSLAALPFLSSLFPKHHSCREDRHRESGYELYYKEDRNNSVAHMTSMALLKSNTIKAALQMAVQ